MTILKKTVALLMCLCAVAGLFGCQNPTEPTVSGEPAQVKVMTLNVAYYDGIFTNNQHLKNLAYPGQTKEQDYTFAERADRLRSLLKFYTPDVFFLNEFNFAWWKEVISGENAILKELNRYSVVTCPSVGLAENGGTAEKLTFHFADALNYVGNLKKQGFEASLVTDETYGTVLKIQAAEHMASGAISIDYGELMKACGLTPVNTKECTLVKITYLANASYSTESGVMRLGMLKEGMNIVAETNSLGLKTYGKWATQTLALSLMPSSVQGVLNTLMIFNAEGALQGDAIYIASIEFLK